MGLPPGDIEWLSALMGENWAHSMGGSEGGLADQGGGQPSWVPFIRFYLTQRSLAEISKKEAAARGESNLVIIDPIIRNCKFCKNDVSVMRMAGLCMCALARCLEGAPGRDLLAANACFSLLFLPPFSFRPLFGGCPACRRQDLRRNSQARQALVLGRAS